MEDNLKHINITVEDKHVDVEMSDNIMTQDIVLVFARLVLDLKHNGVDMKILKRIIGMTDTLNFEENKHE